jgi:hypothetical protein
VTLFGYTMMGEQEQFLSWAATQLLLALRSS